MLDSRGNVTEAEVAADPFGEMRDPRLSRNLS
jgi:hypothetical protein